MSMIRPEAAEALRRWAEPASALIALTAGLWVATRGGWLLAGLGAGLAAIGAGWAMLAFRRLRFQLGAAAPGLVEVDEGRIRYLHPRLGGEVSLPDLAEIRLLSMRGRSVWRLRDADRVLLVPLDSAGAEALFDAFAALPGLTSADLVAGLRRDMPPVGGTLPAPAMADRLIWHRGGAKGQGGGQGGLSPIHDLS